jgi:hypothetical protein
MVMAVLKGSISTRGSLQRAEMTAATRVTARMTYLTHFSRRSVRACRRRRGIRASFDSIATSSWSAPNGQSHPQKVPRPQTTSVTTTYTERIAVIGSYRKKAQL